MSAEQVAAQFRQIRQVQRLRTLERTAGPRGARIGGGVGLATSPLPQNPLTPVSPARPTGDSAEVVAVRGDQMFEPGGTFVLWATTVSPPVRNGFLALTLPSEEIPLAHPALYTVSLDVDWHGEPGGIVEVWVGTSRAEVVQSGTRLTRDVLVVGTDPDAPLRVALRHGGAVAVRAAVKATVTLGNRVVEDHPERDLDAAPETKPATPAAPGVIAGATLDNAFLDVSWAAPTVAVDSWEVVATRVSDGVSTTVEVPGAELDARVDWLRAGTAYDVRIYALTDGVLSDPSLPTSVTTVADQTVPGQVSGVKVAPALEVAVASWNESTEIDVRGGAGRYEYAVDGGAWTDAGPATVVTLGPFDPETAHTFEVRAVDASGNIGPASASVAFTMPPAVPTGSITADKLDLTIGGANLVPDASFESTDSLAAWPVSGQATIDRTTDVARSGSYALRFTGTGSVNTPYVATDRIYDVQPGDAVTVSAYGQRGAGTTNTQRAVIRFYDAAAAHIATVEGVEACPEGTWTRIVASGVAPAATDYVMVWLYPVGALATGQTLYYDDVQLEVGDVVTAWAPPPAEILPGTIVNASLGDGVVSTLKLADGAATAAKIGAGAVTETKVGPDAITTPKLAAGAVVADKLAAGAVTANKLSVIVGGGNRLTNSNFGNGTSGWATYNNSSGTEPHTTTIEPGGKFGANAYRVTWSVANTSTKGVYTGANIVADEGWRWLGGKTYVVSWWARASLTQPVAMHVASNAPAMTLDWISNPVLSADWQLYAVRYTRSADTNDSLFLTIEYGKGGTGWVEFDGVQVERGEVATAWAPQASELLPGTILATHLAADSVTTSALAAGSVVAAKIGAEAVVAGKIAAGAVTATTVASGAILTDKLDAGAVTATKLAAGSVVAGKIAANSVTATELVAGTITAASGILADAVITAAKIADAQVTSAKIVSLKANQITSDTLTSTVITLGSGGVFRAGRTAAPFHYFIQDAAGLRFYKSGTAAYTGGTLVFNASVSTGDLTMAGLTATGATITGTINATGGEFSGNITITGTLAASGTKISANGIAITEGSGLSNRLQFISNFGTESGYIQSQGASIRVYSGGGHVYITSAQGTVTLNPSSLVSIVASGEVIRLDGAGGAAQFISFFRSGSGVARSGYVGFGSSTTTHFYVYNEQGGNVYTLTGSGGAFLEQHGDALATGYDFVQWSPRRANHGDIGGTTYYWRRLYSSQGPYSASDVNLKEDIEPLPLGLAFVRQLETIRWHFPEEDGYRDGFSAQQVDTTVQAFAPKGGLHRGRPWSGLDRPSPEGAAAGTEHLMLQESQLLAPLVKAVQELAAEVDELRALLPVS